jgi:hypothetical protein
MSTSTTDTKANVYRCKDAGCDPKQAHWITVSKAGYVTTWQSWSRAMLRATKGY